MEENRVNNVIRYCRQLATIEPSAATGVDMWAMMKKQMALEILYMLGEDITNCEVQHPLNYTLGNNERDLK